MQIFAHISRTDSENLNGFDAFIFSVFEIIPGAYQNMISLFKKQLFICENRPQTQLIGYYGIR